MNSSDWTVSFLIGYICHVIVDVIMYLPSRINANAINRFFISVQLQHTSHRDHKVLINSKCFLNLLDKVLCFYFHIWKSIYFHVCIWKDIKHILKSQCKFLCTNRCFYLWGLDGGNSGQLPLRRNFKIAVVNVKSIVLVSFQTMLYRRWEVHTSLKLYLYIPK